MEGTIRGLLFASIDRDISAQEMAGIALGYGPYRTNMITAKLSWSANVRMISRCSGIGGGVRTRFLQIEIYWNRSQIWSHICKVMRAHHDPQVPFYEKIAEWSVAMNAVEFARHFAFVQQDCGEGQDEITCWKILRREAP